MKKVNYLRTHQSVFMPGIGELGSAVPSSTKTIPGLQMTLVTEGVLLEVDGSYGIVPYGNISYLGLESPYALPIVIEKKSK